MVWMISNFLQILEILTYLRIQLPGNVMQIQSGLADFIHLYTISPDYLTHLLITPIFGEAKTNNERTMMIGISRFTSTRGEEIIYNSINFYVSLVLLFTFLLFITIIVTKLESILCKCFKRPLKHLKHKLCWNTLIRFVIETYSPVCIAVFVGLKNI
jgi:hypothetical protein